MNQSNPQPGPEPLKLFSKQDILELLVDQGFDETNCFIDANGYNLISELAQNFVQQILDTYKHKKKQITVLDIKKAVSMKFPDIQVGESIENKVVLQNRSNALEQIDQRVRDIEKKYYE